MNLQKSVAVLLTGFFLSIQVHAEHQRTYCNPVDIDYRFEAELPQNRVNFPGEPLTCRASADPVIINHKVDGKTGGYYMVATSGRGYWKSQDLVNWRHVVPDHWPSGRVDGPHYTMSITKTLTSVTLARAIQLGLLEMEDLDKPIIDFMPEIDRSKIQPGVETITIRDALYMKSGLRFADNINKKLATKYSKQAYFQKLFENTAPITPESKEYKYTGNNPEMILMILDIRAPGTIQEFIAKEVAGKVGASCTWKDRDFGVPGGGAGCSFTSRDLMKFGTAIIQGGKFNGEQLLSADYVAQIMAPKEKKGYYYYFHDRPEKCAGKSLRFNSGVGAGGQYMGTLPELNMVVVATAHNRKAIRLPLDAIMEHLVPLFID